MENMGFKTNTQTKHSVLDMQHAHRGMCVSAWPPFLLSSTETSPHSQLLIYYQHYVYTRKN